MSAADELLEAVRARCKGTSYEVTATPTGFDVAIDITDRSWQAMAYQRHILSTWSYHVKVVDDGSKILSITDDVRDLSWSAGVDSDEGAVPTLSLSASVGLGRFESKGFRKTWGKDDSGTFEKVGDFSFDAAEGRDLIRGPASELGWQEKAGAAQRTGLIVGVGTIVLLVLAGIVVLIAFATGHL